jgi:hypothetical protein
MTNEITPKKQDNSCKIPEAAPEAISHSISNMPLAVYRQLLGSLFEKFENIRPVENKVFY